VPDRDDRRYTDARMNSMEEDIRELRSTQKEMAADVTAIREKIFNGFDKTVRETHEEVKELRRLQSKVDELRKSDTVEARLQSCPLRSELTKQLEKRIYLAIAIMSVVITVASFVGSLLGG